MSDQRRQAQAVLLVTGMSGAGKSTVLTELAFRGHPVVDTDEPGWIIESTADSSEPLWDLDRVASRVGEHHAGWLFIAGCVANQGAMYDRFDAVVLLTAPIDTLLERVANRANPFGSTPDDRAKIATDKHTFEPALRAGATHEIDTRAPIADVVLALEQIATARGR